MDPNDAKDLNGIRVHLASLLQVYDMTPPAMEAWVAKKYPPGTLTGNAWQKMKVMEPKLRALSQRLNSGKITALDEVLLDEAVSAVEECGSIIQEMQD
jgi:hypothetical protein